jgi:hypothetical protein
MENSKILLKQNKKTTSLDKFAGKWVAFDEKERIVGYDESLEELMKKMKKKGLEKKVSVFLVPRKDEGPYIL